MLLSTNRDFPLLPLCTHPLGPSFSSLLLETSTEVSKFDWQYSGTETAYVLEGGGMGAGLGWGVMGSWAAFTMVINME